MHLSPQYSILLLVLSGKQFAVSFPSKISGIPGINERNGFQNDCACIIVTSRKDKYPNKIDRRQVFKISTSVDNFFLVKADSDRFKENFF